ncbi:MAG: acyl-CoA dehydrogenase family protein, partial [Pseudomonadota bacterium]
CSSDLFLPDEAIMVRKTAREFCDDVLRPIAHELNSTAEHRDGFRHDVFKEIAKAGLYKVPFAKDVGGLGLEFPTLGTSMVLEELGYYSPGVASAMFDGQAILVGTTLDRIGGAIREQWLPKLIRGEFVGSFATSEPMTSTDLSVQATQTVATKTADGWTINGKKRWITNSVAADIALVLCRTDASMTAFLIDMHTDGVAVSDPDKKMGNHAQLTADIAFNNVKVGDDCVLGGVGKGLNTMLAALSLGRIGIGAVGVGMAQRAVDVASHYISERHVFGQPIARFQHWQFTFADHATSLETTRTLIHKAAMVFDKTGNPEPYAAMAKVKGSELAVDVARDAIQACGGYGFARYMEGDKQAWPLEAIYRDSKIGEIYEGANEVQRWVIARSLFGRDITG